MTKEELKSDIKESFIFAKKTLILISIVMIITSTIAVLIVLLNNKKPNIKEVIHQLSIISILFILGIPFIMFLIHIAICLKADYSTRNYANKDIKEKRNQWFVAIICIVLLILAFTTQGQTERYVRYDNETMVVTKMPVKPMRFIQPSKIADTLTESVYLSIYSDSTSNNIKYRVYAYYPLSFNVQGAEIKIGFPDGSIDVFKQYRFDQANNYSEFEISKEMYNKLKYNKFDYLSFVYLSQCINIKDKDFFIKFLAVN